LLKAIKAAAEQGILLESIEDVETLERIRSSLWLDPVQIDHRSLGLHINVQKGLSDEALERIEQMAKIM